MTSPAVWPAVFGHVRRLAAVMPRRLTLALVLAVAGALTEGIGLVALVPLLQLIGIDVQHGGLGTLARWVEWSFGQLGLSLSLPTVLATYVALMAGSATLRWWQTVVYSEIRTGLTAHVRKRLHRAVIEAAWPELVKHRLSDLTHALTAQTEQMGTTIQVALRLFVDGLFTVMYVAAMLYVSPVVTGLVLVAGLGLLLFLWPKTRTATALGERLARLGGDAFRAVLEHVQGIKTVKSYGAEARGLKLFADAADGLARTARQIVMAQADARWRFDVGATLVLGAVLYVAIRGLAAPPSTILIVIFAFARVLPRVAGLEQGSQLLRSMLPNCAAVTSLEEQLARHPERSPDRRDPVAVHRAVRLMDVTFAYDQDHEARPALADVSLAIPAGRTTAITGPSGSGKTTVADLVLGLLVPRHGRVLIDDVPLTAERLTAWREQIGYVPQDAFLLHDTVRANLLWARPDASEAEMHETLTAAAAADFVERLPRGLDTVLGDRGVRLSGGERQRLQLARALLRRPALLILDEATSSLDSENERRVQAAIEKLHGRLTILVITHRLTTIRDADLIHVLEAGRLLESGTWDDLVARGGRFRALCQAQGLVV